MNARRPQGLTPALPSQNRRSSLLSAASSPRTPCGSPKWSPIYFPSVPNRNSTDSWNSSNGPDESEWEWKPDQILLLTRTLDALPAHLVTPFIGPVPPSNLLDKIARGVAHAKGPVDWPHSVRATRVKLLELAKKRAKEEALQQHLDDSDRENKFDAELQSPRGSPDVKRNNIRRPLYRQNSMDFMNVAGPHLDEDNITRLSNRLQRTDNTVPTTIYHPYMRKSRLQPSTADRSPPPPGSLTTPSSSTLTSAGSWTSSFSTRSRRSVSSLSTTSSMSISSVPAPASNDHLPRVMETGLPPTPPPKDTKLPKLGSKRAPSYGVLVQGIKHEKETGAFSRHERQISTSSCPSSDEEEKSRSGHAKKQKTRVHISQAPARNPKEALPPVPSAVKSPPSTPVLQRSFAQNGGSGLTKSASAPSDLRLTTTDQIETSRKAASPVAQRRRLPMNLQRNPSILGEELPQLSPSKPAKLAQPATPVFEIPHSPICTSPPSSTQPSPSPVQAQSKMLRRVKRMAPGRRISFGSSPQTVGDVSADSAAVNVEPKGNERTCLGSAFQMH